jgi:hypothetical protein
MILNKSKICSKCGEVKSFNDFYKRIAMKDGYYNECKKCWNILNKLRSQSPKAKLSLKKSVQRYSKTLKGREAAKRSARTWSKKNPIKYAANIKLKNAIYLGKLTKENNCSCCGITGGRLHGHHDDYALPLSVRWLCMRCHREWHKINGEGLNG